MEQASDQDNKNEGGQKGGFTFHDKVEGKIQTFIDGNVDQLNIGSELSVEQREQVAALVQPVKEQVESAPPEMRPAAEQKVDELQTELTKGPNANADRLNKIVDGILDMVPGALSALVTMFGSPILGGLVGPVTKMILGRLETK